MNRQSFKLYLLSASTLVVTLLPCSGLLAATGDAPAKMPVGAPELINVGGGLIAVVIAIIVLGVIYARTQNVRAGTNGIINIVATQAIGPKERIAVVEVADKHLLVGMTTTHVQTLHVFDQSVVFEATPKISFSERLKATMQGEEK